MRWPKYWSFSFSISPSNEHPGLNSFSMNWLDLLAVQGTLKSLLQHHSSKASIFLCSAFSAVQHSQPYMTTGKTIALTRWTFVGKVMSLLFNMLSRLAIIFLPRSKCFLISWLWSPSAVMLEPQKIKSGNPSTVSPSISHEVMRPDAMVLLLLKHFLHYLELFFLLFCFLFPTIKFSLELKPGVKTNFISPGAQVRNLLLNLIVYIPVQIKSTWLRGMKRQRAVNWLE